MFKRRNRSLINRLISHYGRQQKTDNSRIMLRRPNAAASSTHRSFLDVGSGDDGGDHLRNSTRNGIDGDARLRLPRRQRRRRPTSGVGKMASLFQGFRRRLRLYLKTNPGQKGLSCAISGTGVTILLLVLMHAFLEGCFFSISPHTSSTTRSIRSNFNIVFPGKYRWKIHKNSMHRLPFLSDEGSFGHGRYESDFGGLDLELLLHDDATRNIFYDEDQDKFNYFNPLEAGDDDELR